MAAAKMTEEEREAVGVRHRLPQTWEEARDALEGDEALKGLLGDVVGGFLTLREVCHFPAAFPILRMLIVLTEPGCRVARP